jgi:pescadillo protein
VHSPREIPKKNNSLFAAFHKKDISMLNTNPMCWFIRDHARWLKKCKKRLHRGEQSGAPEPIARYAQIIHSRYPTFADAVRALDDALTAVALFAQMSGTMLIPSERVVKCRRLMMECHDYIAHFEAVLEGEKVLRFIPHSFPLQEDSLVDHNVLLDFLELYEHLVGFVQLEMKYSAKSVWCFHINSIVDPFPSLRRHQRLPL